MPPASPRRSRTCTATWLSLYSRPEVHPLLVRALERVVVNLQPTPASQTVYTDDWAPIEWITNRMVLSYVLFGDMENIQEGANP